jgi:iron complex outermembrane receptor protein
LNAIHLSGAYLDGRQSAQFHLLSGHEITYQAWNGLPAQYLENEALRTYNSAGAERPGTPHPDEVDNYTQRHFLGPLQARTLRRNCTCNSTATTQRGFGFYEQYKADQDIAEYGLLPGFQIDTVIPPMDLSHAGAGWTMTFTAGHLRYAGCRI